MKKESRKLKMARVMYEWRFSVCGKAFLEYRRSCGKLVKAQRLYEKLLAKEKLAATKNTGIIGA